MNTLYIYDGEVDIELSCGGPFYWYSLGNGSVCCERGYCLNDVDRLNMIALELRDEYSDYIYSLNNLFIENGLIHDDRISAYFLSDLSNKRTEIFHTYSSICHLTLIKERMKSIPIQRGVFNGCSQSFVLATKSLYPNCSVTLKNIKKSSVSIIRQLYSQARFFIGALARIAHIRFIDFKNPKISELENLFLTRFPMHFDKNYQEDKYGKLFTNKDYYLISILTDGIHQNLRFKSYKRNIRLISSKLKNSILLDSYLRLFDVVLAIIFSVKYQLHRIILSRLSYNFKDIDITAFISLELNQSFIRIPRLIMYQEAIKAVFKQYKVNNFIYYLHEYCYGRYFTYMLNSFFPDVNTIGFQSGPAARRKLLYHLSSHEPDLGRKDYIRHLPMPDKVLAEDSNSVEIYNEAGYSNVILMDEIYRLRYLKDIKRKNVQPNTILVAFGLNDGQSILNFLRNEITENKDKKYILKLHPRSSRNNSIINQSQEFNDSNIEIGNAHISEYLGFVSEVIVSYSSVGTEADMLGIPIRLIKLPNKINESPLLDIQELDPRREKNHYNLEHKLFVVREHE